MAKPKLRTVTRTQGNNLALKDGAVTPQGFELNFEEVPVLVQAFRRMVREQAFDVCEMAFTTYLCAKAHGKPLTALPVFLTRGFHHGAIVGNTKSGIRSPKDLEGQRVGVSRGYTVTTGVWARGILQEEHDVDLSRITWLLSGDEHVAEYHPPNNVAPLKEGRDLEDLVATGELAAAIGVNASTPDIEPLIANPAEAGFRALARRGLYPINHLVVARNDVLERYPGLARAVFDAFAEAKHRYVDRLRNGEIANPSPTDLMYQRVMDILVDPLPYGIEPNRHMIDTLVNHAVCQEILDEPPDLGALFAEGTHDRIA